MRSALPLAERARLSPDAPALEASGQALSFAALQRAAARAAGGLRSLGVRPGDAVALRLPNGLGLVVAVHATWLAGAVLVPLGTRLTAAELVPQLEAAAARLLVAAAEDATAEEAAEVARVPRALPRDGRLERARGRPALPASQAPLAESAELGATAAVLFTSGTSGRPKGARLTHGNLLFGAFASGMRLEGRPGDRWLACLPLGHVGGLAILVRSAVGGASVLVHERFEAEAVARALEGEGVTHVSLVPTQLVRLLDAAPGLEAPALRAALLGGASTPPALEARARERGLPLRPTYGLTETASQAATRAGGAPPREAGAVGPALFGTALRILGPGGAPLPPGAEGEIAVRGPTVFAGYLDAGATRRALRDGWLRTGDVGRLDEAGALTVLDRREDLVVTGGLNVYPAEVEAALAAHAAVAEAGVAGLPDPEWGRRVVAWVVPQPGARLEPEALRAFCRERLARYKVPKEIRLAPALPRTASGKLLRRRLAAGPPAGARA